MPRCITCLGTCVCLKAEIIIENGCIHSGDGLVHRGTSWYKFCERKIACVEFKEFFSMMKNRISNGTDVPYFFKDLIAMITDVAEEEWGTPKDPSTKLSKESTLRSYAKRGLTQKFAQSIVYRLSTEMFVESMAEKPKEVLRLLAADYKAYDSTADANNISQKLADCFVDIIRRAAGLVHDSELERQKIMQQALELKFKYGEYLRDEADNACPFPGCGRLLSVSEHGIFSPVYEVALIDKKKAPAVDNLMAMCPIHQATYALDDSKKVCKELVGIKKILVAHKQSLKLLDDMPLEKGIVGVLKRIKDLKEEEFLDPSLDPQDISKKLPPAKNRALYGTVKAYVDTYYVNLKVIITNADKRGEIDYDVVQDQMKAIYKKLKKAKKTNVEIFNEISDKLHKVSLQEDIYCQIVVSYFIAKCDVFEVPDAVAE